MQHFKAILAISLLMASVFFFSRCFHDNAPAGNDPRGDQYAGSKACMHCHRELSNSYAHSNHYKTSAGVITDSLKKSVALSDDRFYFTDTSYIRIEEKNHFLFQSYVGNGVERATEKFDIAFGSAEKAQTYGYWKNGKLYQLPLTHFAGMHTWANSPGFPPGRAYFGRVIESRCFECHASYINKVSVQSGPLSVSEKPDSSSIVYGIDCERCHGPAAAHVKFQEENPAVTTSKYIVPFKSLSRQQKLDVCALCHSGNDRATQRSLFAFMPGDTLSHFYYPDFGAGSPEPDVHGKQLQLLERSECYKKSDLTCTSCHDGHGREENQLAGFISQCMNCHPKPVHATGTIPSNGQNCISCHMPLQSSKIISFNTGAGLKNIPYFIRTHKIAIYK